MKEYRPCIDHGADNFIYEQLWKSSFVCSGPLWHKSNGWLAHFCIRPSVWVVTCWRRVPFTLPISELSWPLLISRGFWVSQVKPRSLSLPWRLCESKCGKCLTFKKINRGMYKVGQRNRVNLKKKWVSKRKSMLRHQECSAVSLQMWKWKLASESSSSL